MSRISVTYLALTRAPEPCVLVSPKPGARVSLRKLDISDYLAIYRDVGGPWRWDQRLRMPRHELIAYLDGPSSRIFCLSDRSRDGGVLGFCEFDATDAADIQLMNFGVVPALSGRGFGRLLLGQALTAIWRDDAPKRISLHTDTWDHPKARALYLSVGFEIEAEKMQEPDDL